MKVHLESTTKLVELVVGGAAVPARVWEGATDDGVPCHAYVTRIAANYRHDLAEFERDLQEQRAPSPAVAATPARLALDPAAGGPRLAPPLSITQPVATTAELRAAIEYTYWLADRLTRATGPLGPGPMMFAHLLLAAAGATAASVKGDDEMLSSLFEALGEWAAKRPSGYAGLTCRESVDAGLPPSGDLDPRTN